MSNRPAAFQALLRHAEKSNVVDRKAPDEVNRMDRTEKTENWEDDAQQRNGLG